MQEQQYAALWHSMMGIFLVCVIFGHIYIGTVGMQGAFDAMGSGQVDENWAKEHHSSGPKQELAKKVNDLGIGSTSRSRRSRSDHLPIGQATASHCTAHSRRRVVACVTAARARG